VADTELRQRHVRVYGGRVGIVLDFELAAAHVGADAEVLVDDGPDRAVDAPRLHEA
jgi:hypothetical protein